MSSCKKCGAELVPNGKFCSLCGSPVESIEESRTSQYSGNIVKCPNCGNVVESFVPFCSSCGFEFRNVEANDSVKELARQLNMVELEKYEGEKLTESEKKERKKNQKSDLIRNFPIPNSKEAILEFSFMASSNIVDDSDLSMAWYIKMQQAYEKSKLMFENEPEFSLIEKMYLRKEELLVKASNDTKKQLSKKRRGAAIRTLVNNPSFPSVVIIFGVFIFIAFLLWSLTPTEEEKQERAQRQAEKEAELELQEKKLEDTVQEIEKCIQEQDYDKAMRLAKTLYYDSDTFLIKDDKEIKWENLRTSYIEEIERLMKKQAGDNDSAEIDSKKSTNDASEDVITMPEEPEFPAFEKLIFEGTGDSVIKNVSLPKGVFVAHLTIKNEISYSVKFIHGNNDELLVKDGGDNFDGMFLLKGNNLDEVEDGSFEISCKGDWQIEIDKLSGSSTRNICGENNKVTGYFFGTGLVEVANITIESTNYYEVKLFEYDMKMDNYTYSVLASGEGEPYSAEVLVDFLNDDAYYFVVVIAQGKWSVDFELGDTLKEYS